MKVEERNHHSLTRRLAVAAFFIGVPLFGIFEPLLNVMLADAEWTWWPAFWFAVWLTGPAVWFWFLKKADEAEDEKKETVR